MSNPGFFFLKKYFFSRLISVFCPKFTYRPTPVCILTNQTYLDGNETVYLAGIDRPTVSRPYTPYTRERSF